MQYGLAASIYARVIGPADDIKNKHLLFLLEYDEGLID